MLEVDVDVELWLLILVLVELVLDWELLHVLLLLDGTEVVEVDVVDISGLRIRVVVFEERTGPLAEEGEALMQIRVKPQGEIVLRGRRPSHLCRICSGH